MFKILEEGNFANSGSFRVTIKHNEFEEDLYSMDNIIDTIMDMIEKNIHNANKEVIMTYFKSNFKNWLKNDAPGYEQYNPRWPNKELFYEAMYPKTSHIIAQLAHESETEYSDSAMTEEEILSKFPPFVQKNVNDTIVFSGGRRLKFKRINGLEMTSEVADYINAVLNDAPEIQRAQLSFTHPSKVTVPDMLERAHRYHTYLIRLRNALNEKQAAEMYMKTLQNGSDYKVADTVDDYQFRIVTSQTYLDVEGKFMGHCVGSYWQDIAQGRQTIISVVKRSLKASIATIALRGKWVPGQQTETLQIKYHKNQAIPQEHWDALWKFFISNKINVVGDKGHIGGRPSNEVIKFFQEKEKQQPNA